MNWDIQLLRFETTAGSTKCLGTKYGKSVKAWTLGHRVKANTILNHGQTFFLWDSEEKSFPPDGSDSPYRTATIPIIETQI
ncbi:hypothetical protein WG66_003562 [Moniliophthora roreri]|nr:hypothetical protein WG66_003562 [Moniliophthora roreri]